MFNKSLPFLSETSELFQSRISWNLECMINRNQRQLGTGEILSEAITPIRNSPVKGFTRKKYKFCW